MFVILNIRIEKTKNFPLKFILIGYVVLLKCTSLHSFLWEIYSIDIQKMIEIHCHTVNPCSTTDY